MIDKMNYIKKIVEEHFGSGDLRERTRCRQVADNKKIFVYLVRKYTRATYREIGDYLHLTHASIIAAYRGCEHLMRYKSFVDNLSGIEEKLKMTAAFDISEDISKNNE